MIKVSQGFKYTFLAAFCWAISIILTKFIFNLGEDAYNLSFWGSLLALPYWFIALKRGKIKPKSVNAKDWLILIGIAFISTVGTSVTENLAIKHGSAVNFSFLFRTVILFTMIFAYFFLGEKLTLKKFILAGLIISRAYLLTSNGQKLVLTKGDIFTLTEAALVAFGNNILGKIATSRLGPTISASTTMIMGFIPLALIAMFNRSLAWPVSWPLLMVMVGINLLITVFRYRGLQQASATFVTMVFSFTPVMVAFMAIPLLKESLS